MDSATPDDDGTREARRTTGSNDEAALAVIDHLNELCQEAPDDLDAQVALWTAVAALRDWFFVDRGTPGSPRPYGIAGPNGLLVCVYTSPERAEAGAVANGLVAEGAPIPLFSVPLPGALDWLLTLADTGVVGIVLDYPQLAAWCPLPNLVRLRRDRMPDESA